MIASGAGTAVLTLAPLAGLATDVLAQLALVRLVRTGAQLRMQFVAFAVGYAATAALLASMLGGAPFAPGDRIGYFLLHSMTYACFGFGLFNVINANVSSLRLRILKEYFAHDPEPLADAALYARYPASEMIEVRLERLQTGGQIVMRDGRYYSCGGAVVAIGHFFAALRRLLLGS